MSNWNNRLTAFAGKVHNAVYEAGRFIWFNGSALKDLTSAHEDLYFYVVGHGCSQR